MLSGSEGYQGRRSKDLHWYWVDLLIFSVAGGGDSTFSWVLDLLEGGDSRPPVALLPLGRLLSFASRTGLVHLFRSWKWDVPCTWLGEGVGLQWQSALLPWAGECTLSYFVTILSHHYHLGWPRRNCTSGLLECWFSSFTSWCSCWYFQFPTVSLNVHLSLVINIEEIGNILLFLKSPCHNECWKLAGKLTPQGPFTGPSSAIGHLKNARHAATNSGTPQSATAHPHHSPQNASEGCRPSISTGAFVPSSRPFGSTRHFK